MAPCMSEAIADWVNGFGGVLIYSGDDQKITRMILILDRRSQSSLATKESTLGMGNAFHRYVGYFLPNENIIDLTRPCIDLSVWRFWKSSALLTDFVTAEMFHNSSWNSIHLVSDAETGKCLHTSECGIHLIADRYVLVHATADKLPWHLVHLTLPTIRTS